jgi:hypothetical protein
MASSHRNRTPSTLEPYLALPPSQSLTLLTNTLGCSANWLTSRFAISALNDTTNPTPVVLVSWTRDLAFWKDEIRRAAVGGYLFRRRWTHLGECDWHETHSARASPTSNEAYRTKKHPSATNRTPLTLRGRAWTSPAPPIFTSSTYSPTLSSQPHPPSRLSSKKLQESSPKLPLPQKQKTARPRFS